MFIALGHALYHDLLKTARVSFHLSINLIISTGEEILHIIVDFNDGLCFFFHFA